MLDFIYARIGPTAELIAIFRASIELSTANDPVSVRMETGPFLKTICALERVS
jgi:hypothetical protein